MGVKLIDNKDKVIAALRVQVANGLNNAGAFFVNEAQANANIDTGFMMSHILTPESERATPQSLSTTVRSLANYSAAQNDGRFGNLFFTRAWLATRAKFRQFILGEITAGTVGGGVIRSAQQEFQHHVTERGLVVTKIPAFGGGRVMRGPSGRFGGSYGGKR